MAVILTGYWSGVDVILRVGSTAGVEGTTAIVLNLTVATNGEATSRRGARVALELSGRWRQDASAAVGVGDLTVVDAVGSCVAAAANAVLAIGQLRNLARLTARGSELKAAAGLLPRKDGSRSTTSEGESRDVRLHGEDGSMRGL